MCNPGLQIFFICRKGKYHGCGQMCVARKIVYNCSNGYIKFIIVFKYFSNRIFIAKEFFCSAFCKYCLVGFTQCLPGIALKYTHIKNIKKFSISHHYTVLLELRSEEHTSELQSRLHLVCRLL